MADTKTQSQQMEALAIRVGTEIKISIQAIRLEIGVPN